jgi:hypothetical protein
MFKICCKFYAFRHHFLIGSKRKTLPPCLGAHPNPTSEKTSTSVSGQYDVRSKGTQNFRSFNLAKFSKSFQPYQACVIVLHTASKLSLLDTSLFTLWHKYLSLNGSPITGAHVLGVNPKDHNHGGRRVYRDSSRTTSGEGALGAQDMGPKNRPIAALFVRSTSKAPSHLKSNRLQDRPGDVGLVGVLREPDNDAPGVVSPPGGE